MNYQDKYIKYKQKYFNLLEQQGSGISSLFKIDPILLRDKVIRFDKCKPEIYENVDEILKSALEILKKYRNITDGLDSVKRIMNINSFYQNIFEKYNNLLLINQHDNKNGFYNSLYIHTILSGKKDIITNNLYKKVRDEKDYYIKILDDVNKALTENEISNPWNISNLKKKLNDNLSICFNDFEFCILILSIDYCYKKVVKDKEYIYSLITSYTEQESLSYIYSNIFNCKILIIQKDLNYDIIKTSLFVPDIKNAVTDHLIIIRHGSSFYQSLVLSNGNFKERKELFDDICKKVGIKSEPIDYIPDSIIIRDNVITEKDGHLQIYKNMDEFMSQWEKYLKDNGFMNKNQQFINVEKNAGDLYKPLFQKFNNLLLINPRGDGNCFNNSLFIFSVEAKKNDGFKKLFTEAIQVKLSEFIVKLYNSVLDNVIDVYNKNLIDLNKPFNKSLYPDASANQINMIKKNQEEVKISFLKTIKEANERKMPIVLSEDIEIKNFINAILILAINNAITNFGEGVGNELKDLFKGFFNDQRPEVYPYASVYVNVFNCNMLIIEVDSNNYEFIQPTLIESFKQNNDTDHIVIIKRSNIHFQVLILHNSTIIERKELFTDIFKYLKNKYPEKMKGFNLMSS